jgi:methionyl-tRNA formyltransferase
MLNKVLFLSDGNYSIHKFLLEAGLDVDCSTQPVTDLSKYDLVLSFGYRHLIPQSVLETAKRDPLNLHISLLPYNRGAHPNFWAHYDGTPSGVTIHLIDTGIDTGKIVFQKRVIFLPTQITFRQRYNFLIHSIENLFMHNFLKIINNNFETFDQKGAGTFHLKSDLPAMFKGWDSVVEVEINRLKSLL